MRIIKMREVFHAEFTSVLLEPKDVEETAKKIVPFGGTRVDGFHTTFLEGRKVRYFVQMSRETKPLVLKD